MLNRYAVNAILHLGKKFTVPMPDYHTRLAGRRYKVGDEWRMKVCQVYPGVTKLVGAIKYGFSYLEHLVSVSYSHLYSHIIVTLSNECATQICMAGKYTPVNLVFEYLLCAYQATGGKREIFNPGEFLKQQNTALYRQVALANIYIYPIEVLETEIFTKLNVWFAQEANTPTFSGVGEYFTFEKLPVR